VTEEFVVGHTSLQFEEGSKPILDPWARSYNRSWTRVLRQLDFESLRRYGSRILRKRAFHGTLTLGMIGCAEGRGKDYLPPCLANSSGVYLPALT
jgi:hypothetical protein